MWDRVSRLFHSVRVFQASKIRRAGPQMESCRSLRGSNPSEPDCTALCVSNSAASKLCDV